MILAIAAAVAAAAAPAPADACPALATPEALVCRAMESQKAGNLQGAARGFEEAAGASSSGGIRNGLEIAKCIALGANMCGMAFPFLRHASKSFESLCEFTNKTLIELKSTMFLVGSKNIAELAKF